MLTSVYSVIDHRWLENVIKTKKYLTSSVIYYWTDARQHGIYFFYIITKQTATYKAFVYFKIFQHNAKADLCQPRRTQKYAIWRYLLSIQNEAPSFVTMRNKELWLVQENHTTVKPDFSVAPRGMKTYSESRIKLRNLQILKEMLEKSSQFLLS